MRHWAAGRDDPPAKTSSDEGSADEPTDHSDSSGGDPWGADVVYELPGWLATRLAIASPVPAGSFFMGEGDQWPAHEGEFPLWPENADAFFHFEACRTQWHHSDGVRTGLMYDAAWTWVARAQRYRFTPERHALLTLMEGAALRVWNDQLRARAKRLKEAA